MERRILLLYLTIVFEIFGGVYPCATGVLATLPFILEYSVWRGWRQAVIYTKNLEPECNWAIQRLSKCMNLNGVATSSGSSSDRVRILNKMGLVFISPRLRNNATEEYVQFLKELNDMELNTSPYDWAVTTRSEQDFRPMNHILNMTALRFDQNIIVAYPTVNYQINTLGLCDNNFYYKNRNNLKKEHVNRSERFDERCRYKNGTCPRNDGQNSYFRLSERFRNLTKDRFYTKSGRNLPLALSGHLDYNFSTPFIMANVTDMSFKRESLLSWVKRERTQIGTHDKITRGIHVVQYFKVRYNSTLYGNLLGTWSRESSMSRVGCPFPVESRTFLSEELYVGRCNSSDEGTSNLDDDGPSAPTLLDDVAYFLGEHLNATPSVRYYSKLGFRSYEGAWTGLLGAVIETSVDIALEPVTAHLTRHSDMNFIFPIAETMCSIYIRHQETSTVRDIFLAPFNWRLLVCVVAIAILSASAVTLISRCAPVNKDNRPMEYSEALIWSAGILCQQGGNWTPSSPSASTLLISCLMFAVVTYNAYAAFITSVLSVRVASVDNVAAVLGSSEFKIGYIRNGADQMYLMSTKDAQLNAFYIRGYSNAENLVSTAEEGLSRAAKTDYAFFAGQRAARFILSTMSQERGRCALRELAVPSTKAQLAFPMPIRSPYAKPTLVGLLELRSGGSLARLGATLVPPMPQCDPSTGFASARAADVRSALLLMALGLIASAILGFSEYWWKNKRELGLFFVKTCKSILKKIISLV